MNTAIVTMLSAFGGTIVGGLVSFVLQRDRHRHELALMREEYKTEFMAERTAGKLLSHPGYTCRRFAAIRKHLPGFTDDELRKILVRAGAFRIDRGDEDEWWLLLSREREYLSQFQQNSIVEY